jgi:hypothetical protein
MIALVAFPSYEGGAIVPNVYGDSAFRVSEGGEWDPLQPIIEFRIKNGYIAQTVA